MRRSIGLFAGVFSATLLAAGMVNAESPQGRVVNTSPKTSVKATKKTDATKSVVTLRTHENLDATPEEKQRAAALAASASVEERQVASRVRGLQLLMQKEEQALAQRLAYASKLRAQGLTKNDQKTLDQAEQLERQALDYYLKRVQQFEKASVTTGTSTSRRQQSTRSTPSTRTYRSSRSSSSRSRSRR